MKDNDTATQAIEWFSRTITILIVMIGPGLAGNWLDQRLNTQYLSAIGIFLGLSLGTFILVLLAKNLTPPARGEPIPFEDDEELHADASDETTQ